MAPRYFRRLREMFFSVMASCVLLWNCYVYVGWTSECVHWSSWGAPQHWCHCYWWFAVAFWEELCLCNSCNNSSTTIALLFLITPGLVIYWLDAFIVRFLLNYFDIILWITVPSSPPASLSLGTLYYTTSSKSINLHSLSKAPLIYWLGGGASLCSTGTLQVIVWATIHYLQQWGPCCVGLSMPKSGYSVTSACPLILPLESSLVKALGCWGWDTGRNMSP